MKKSIFLIALAVGLMTSCASKKDLVNCQTENKSLTEKLQDAREDLAGKNARIQALEEQQRGLQQALKNAEAKYDALQQSLDKSLTNASQNNISIEKLVDQINESNQYIRHLVEVKSKSDSLNMVLTNNLTRSLSQDELKEVDVQVLKGVVYISLADNMLYKSGSYEINSRAAETLSKIAKIIKDEFKTKTKTALRIWKEEELTNISRPQGENTYQMEQVYAKLIEVHLWGWKLIRILE